MAQYRSAMGKMIDMEALATKNEKVRAVSNMSVNSRGDTIDSQGNVIKTATQKTNERYAKTVGNRAAQAQPKKQNAAPAQKPKIDYSELNEMERELENSTDDDILVEKIKAHEAKK